VITLFSLTEQGLALAERLIQPLEVLGYRSQIEHRAKPFIPRVQQVFAEAAPQQDALVFICATGIVMRALGPVLKDKYQDAPVLVLDECGQFVIPLLSGHEGGANHLAQQLAIQIQAQPVITTAQSYLNPRYCIGMGCERHCPLDDLERLLMSCLAKAGIPLSQVESLHSIDIKADEQGLITLAEKLGLPFFTWHKDQLNMMDQRLSTRSEYVFNTVGVYGVAESAALYGADQNQNLNKSRAESELVLPKHKNPRATCAIARFYRGDKT